MANIFVDTIHNFGIRPPFHIEERVPSKEISPAFPLSSRTSKALLRRARYENEFFAVSLHTLVDSLVDKKEQLERTISKLDIEIQKKVVVDQEDKRLLTIATKLKNKLKEFEPKLALFPLPGCCLYEGDEFLVNVVAIAEKQERIENSLKLIRTTPGVDSKVTGYFERTLQKLKQGINVPLPDFFHATKTGLEGIIQTQTIKQSITGLAGPGTYISCNNEGEYGYGSHAFAIDERCLIGTQAKFFTGRHPVTNVFYSLWASVLKDLPVLEETVAFIDTSVDDVPYVQALLKELNLNIEVVDRATSEGIQRIFDLSTKRRELPSFHWTKNTLGDYLPSNMYPRSELGNFRDFHWTGE